MFTVEIYAAVRQFVLVERHSRRKAARVFGVSRDTITKMCAYPVPPGYRRSRPPTRPKLDPFVPIIDAILTADKSTPGKQRHTARRIFERLHDAHGFTGGITIVTDYVREVRQRTAEKFVPLSHPPGHAQVDFGEAIGVVSGVRWKLHVFFMSLPHSDAFFINAYPAETTEAFLDGHVSAFALTGLIGHDLFRDRFGQPGKGNDKGKVEGLVKNDRRRFLSPVPVVVACFDEVNARLEADCLKQSKARKSK